MFTMRCIFQKNSVFGMVVICFLPFHLFESRASAGGCFVTRRKLTGVFLSNLSGLVQML